LLFITLHKCIFLQVMSHITCLWKLPLNISQFCHRQLSFLSIPYL